MRQHARRVPGHESARTERRKVQQLWNSARHLELDVLPLHRDDARPKLDADRQVVHGLEPLRRRSAGGDSPTQMRAERHFAGALAEQRCLG